jgi:hypothetical protein
MSVPDRNRDRIILAALMMLGALVFLPGINWGLPSRATDAFLFGPDQKPWTAQEIQSAAGAWRPDPSRAADADANPLLRRDQPVVLNDTPAKQAEIIRRYRLYSNHPDEMLTFMAVARMPASRFDPGMYQYGGMWFYPLGAILRVAQSAKLIKSDLTYYLDHPDEFGRFYVIARLYGAGWGLVGIWAVFALGKRLFPGQILPVSAAACFALMPVVINGAHEVKPHLAGAVLVLLAVLAAVNYVQAGTTRQALIAGVLCGLAFGMVLTALVAFAVIPTMVLLRRDPWRRRIAIIFAAGGIGLTSYCITNPYVPLGLLRPDSPLRTNLANLRQAGALFGKANDRGALANSALLIAEGASLPVAGCGVIGAALAAFSLRRATPAAILLALPALLAAIQFGATAGGKPGEFGRFAILPDTALLLAAFALLCHTAPRSRRHTATINAALLVVLTAGFGLNYLAAFTQDRNDPRSNSSRMAAARKLGELSTRATTLAVRQDPAPYSLPPVNVTRWKFLLLPADGTLTDPLPDVIVRPADAPSNGPIDPRYERLAITGTAPRLPTRISWADKPIEILVRRDLARP